MPTKKNKIFNDPLYGFITIPYDIVFDLIEHPYFQRLRRITQLGLTNVVYTGANHTRFQHVLGTMHLMTHAIQVLRRKGTKISEEEAIGVTIAILLHDIGHGPFSHALEYSIVKEINHEVISELIMDELNKEFDGALDLAIQIFKNQYHKPFLHQMVSSQLDMDRLDYLVRDSFFTGVSEGVVGSERIIKMLDVADNQLVVEAKGIYSLEKFIIARRLMYWQVYLHKTVLAAEHLLTKILLRAKELAAAGKDLFCSPSLHTFLYNEYSREDFDRYPSLLKIFARLDDSDIMGAIKAWQSNEDLLLSNLSQMLLYRKLYKIEMQTTPFTKEEIKKKENLLIHKHKLETWQIPYFIFDGIVENHAYKHHVENIKILHKNGKVADVSESADLLNFSVLSEPNLKYFLCYPKNL